MSITAAAAAALTPASVATPVTVADTLANVSTNLTGLQALAAASKLVSITLTDTTAPVLSITAPALVINAAALVKITSAYTITVTGNATAAQVNATNPALAAKMTNGFAVSDSAANVTTYLAGLQAKAAIGKLVSIALTGTGTQALSLTAAQASASAAAILKITTAYTVTVSSSVTAAQAAAIPAALAAKLTAAVAVSDTAANVAAGLDGLQTLAATGKLGAVALTDTGTANLSITAAQLTTASAALLKIAGTFTITASGTATAAQAAAANAAMVAKLTAGLAVSDSAASVTASLAGLQTLATAGKLASIALTDAGTPALTLTAAQLTANATALLKITGTYAITASGTATAAQAAAVNATLAANLAAGLAVSDTAANVTTSLAGLQSLAALGKLASVALTGTGTQALSLTAAQLAANATALLKITTAYTITATGTATAAQAAASTALAAKLTAGLTVSDTAANVTASLAGLQTLAAASKLASIALTDTGTPALTLTASAFIANTTALLKIAGTYAITTTGTATAAQAAGANATMVAKLTAGLAVSDTAANVATSLTGLQTLAAASKLASIALTDTGTPALTLTASAFIANTTALLKIAGTYAITATGTATAAQAAGANAAMVAKLTAGLAVSDTAANGATSLAGLQTLAAASKLASIALTDTGTPAVTLTAAALVANPAALLKLTGSYTIKVTGTVTATQAGAINASLFAKLSPAVAVTDTLASVATNLTKLQTLAAASRLGAITLTDTGTPTITVTAPAMIQNAATLMKIASPYAITLSGTATAAQANAANPTLVGKLTSGFAVSDTAANVTTFIAGLQTRAAAGALASIALTNAGTPSLALTAAQLVASATALGLITSTYAIAPTGTATVAQAGAIAAPLLARLTAGIAISDSAANVTAGLDALAALAQAGKLASIVTSDAGTPAITVTADTLAADSAALALIADPWSLVVASGTLTAAQALALPAFVTAHLASGLAIADSALNIGAAMAALAAAGAVIGSIALTDSSPVVSVAPADLAAAASVMAKITGAFSIAVSDTVTVAQALAMTATEQTALAAGMTVSDTAARVAAALDALQALGSAIASVGLTNPGTPAIGLTAAQLIADAPLLLKIGGSFGLTVAGTATAAQATAASASLTGLLTQGLAVSDTAASVTANLAALQTLSANGEVASVTVTGGIVSLPAATLLANAAFLAQFAGTWTLAVASGTLTADQATGLYASFAARLASTLPVADAAATVAADLDALQAMGAALGSVTLTDAGTPAIAVTATALLADAGALAKIAGTWTLTVTSGTVTAAQALALDTGLAARLGAGLAVADTAANVGAAIDSLGSSIAAIALTDPGTPSLALTAAQLAADAATLAKISGSYAIALSGNLTAEQATAAYAQGLLPLVTGGAAIRDSAASVQAALDALQSYGAAIASISLSNTGPATITVTAATLAADAAALAKIGGTYTLTVASGTLTVAQTAALPAAVTARLTGSIAIADTAANVAASLGTLGGTVASIALSDSGTPALSVSAATLLANAATLAKIAGSWSLSVASGTLTVAQAQALSGTVTSHLTGGLAIADTAASVAASLDTLDGTVASIALTDTGTPTIGLTATQLIADAATLLKITGTYALSVSGTATATQAAAANPALAAKLTTGLAVADTAASVTANLDALQALATAGKLASVALTSGTAISVSAATLLADQGVLALTAGTWTLTVPTGTLTAAQLLALPAALTARLTGGIAIADTAANVAASLDALQAANATVASVALAGSPATFPVTADQLWHDQAILAKVTAGGTALAASTTAAASAAASANLGSAPAYTGALRFTDTAASIAANLDSLQALQTAGRLGTVTLTDTGTPTITLTASQISSNSPALALTTGAYALAVSTGTLAAAQVLAIDSSVIARVAGTIAVRDSGPNTVTNLDGLQARLSALSSVSFTTTNPNLSLTAAKLIADIGVLQLATGYTVTVSGTLTAAQAATLANSNVYPRLTTGPALSDTAANLSANLDTLLTLANASKLGSIALTGATVVTVTPAQLANDVAVLRKISTSYTLALTAPLTADQASSISSVLIGKLPANLAVSDLAANVMADLDSLQVLAAGNHLGSITLTDGGTPVLAISSDQLTSDANALAVITGSYQVQLSGGVTAAQATAYAARVTAPVTVSDTAANVAAALANLQSLAAASQLAAIAFTDAGTPSLALTAAAFAANQGALAAIASAFTVTLTGTLTVAQAQSAATAGVLADVTAGAAIADTAASVATALDALQALGSQIASIALTDTGTPALSVTAAALLADTATLAKISGTWSLTATSGTLTAAQALGLGATVTSHLAAGVAVADTAANVATALDALQAAGAAIASIALTDASPALSLTAARLVADAATLAKIAGTFAITASGTLTATQATGLGNGLTAKLTTGLAVADTAANVIANLTSLDTLRQASKLASIALTDSAPPTISLSSTQLGLYAPTLALASGTWTLAVSTGSFTAAQALALPSVLTARLATGLAISDTPASISTSIDALAALGTAIATVALAGASPSLALTTTQLGADATLLGKVSTTYAIALTGSLSVTQAQAAASLLPLVTGGAAIADTAATVQAQLDTLQGLGAQIAAIALTDAGTPTITVTAATLLADAATLAKISGTYSLSVASGTVTAAQATGLSPAVTAHLSAGLAIADTAANVQSALAALQTLGSQVASIALTDAGTPALTVTAAALVANAATLAKIAGTYGLTVSSGTVTVAQALALPAGVTSRLTAGLAVADTAANLAASIDTLGATVASIALTDAGTPSLALTATQLLADAATLAKVTGSYAIALTGSLTVAQAATAQPRLALVTGGAAIADTAATVQAALDTLQSYGAGVASIALTDAGTPSIAVSAATLLADGATLNKIGGSWSLSVASGTLTAAQAAGLSGSAASHLASSVNVADTAANVAAGLDSLQAMGAALGTVALTDAGTPTITVTAATLAADQGALAKTGGTWSLTVSSGTLATAQATTLPAALTARLTAGLAVADTAANVAANLDALQAMGTALASVALSGTGTPTLTVTAATLVADQAALAKTGGTWNLAVASGTLTTAQAIGLDASVAAHLSTGLAVSDTAANVNAALGSIPATVATIALTDATPVISLTGTQFAALQTPLLKVQGTYQIALTGTGTTVAALQSARGNGLAARLQDPAVAIADTAANVLAALDALQSYGSAAGAITLTDAGTPTLSAPAATLFADAATLQKIATGFTLTAASGSFTASQAATFPSGLLSRLTAPVAVADTAANVLAVLPQLTARAASLSQIVLTDSQTAVLALTATQFTASAAVLALLANPGATPAYTVDLTGALTVAQAAAANLSTVNGGAAIADTAANVQAGLATLQSYGAQVASIALTDTGTPTISLSAATAVAKQPVLAKIGGTWSLSIATGTVTAAQAAAFDPSVGAHLAAGLAVSDTAANLATSLDALQANTAFIATVTDTDAALSATAAKIAADAAILAKFTGTWTLTVASGSFTAAQALALPAAVTARLAAPLPVGDTASNIAASLDALQALGATLGPIALSDTGTPSITLTATQLTADAATLLKITGSYALAVSGSATAAQAAAVNPTLAAHLSAGLAVSDSAASVTTSLDGLQALATASKLGSVTLTSGTAITVSAATLLADSGALAAITGTWSLTVASGTVTAAQAAAISPGLAARLSAGLPVADTAASVTASLDGLQTAGGGVASITLTDAGTPTITVTAATLVADAATLAKAGGTWNLAVSSGTVTAAQALALPAAVTSRLTAGLAVADTAANVTAALDSLGATVASIALTDAGTPVLPLDIDRAIADTATLLKITGTYQITVTNAASAAQAASFNATLRTKLTTGLVVEDSASNVATNLDGLQTLFTAGKLAAVTMTSGSLAITAATLVADNGALGTVQGSWTFTVTSGTVTAAQLAALSPAVTAHLSAGLAVADTAANIGAALDALHATGSATASIALTDAGTPAVTLTAAQLIADAATLLKIAGTHGLTVSGTATAGQAAAVNATLAAQLTAALTVSDTAANVAASLAGLQTLFAAGQLASIALTDGGTPTITLTAAALAASLGALSAITGSYSLAIGSGTLTAAQASALYSTATVAAHLTASANVQDTAANVAASAAALAGLGAGLASIALTDAGTPSLPLTAAQLVASSAVWLKITGTYAIAVSGTATAAQATAANTGLLDRVTGGLSVSDTAASVSSAIDALQALGSAVASIALTDAGTPAVTVTAAQLLSDQAALLKVTGTHAITVSGNATAQQAATASATLVALLTAGLAVSDTAANVAASLDGLQTRATASKLASIALTDSGTPEVSVSAATLVADAGALALIGGTWTLTVASGTVTVAQAAALSPSLTAHLSAGLAVSDTAANVAAAIDSLQSLGSAVASIALTDAGTPAVTVTAAQLVSDSAALLKISGSFGITATGSATPAQAAAVNATLRGKLTGSLPVSGTAASVTASLDGLQALAAAAKLGTVTLTDGGTPTVTVTAATLVADSAALALIGSAYSLVVSSGTVTAAQATGLPAAVKARLSTGLAVADTAANTTASLATLQAMASNLASITLTDGGTPTISVTSTTLLANAATLALIGGTWNLTVTSGTVTAAQAAALSPAVTAHLAAGLAVSDTAANIAAAIDSLQSLGSAVASIALTDAGTPAVSVTAAQLVADAPALLKIAGTFGITVTGSTTPAQAAAVNATLRGKLTAAVAVTGTAASVTTSLDGLQTLAAATKLGAVTLTDGGTPTLTVTAATLVADSAALALIGSAYSLAVSSGTVTAAQALALPAAVTSHLAAGLAVADTAANVATNLDALQAVNSRIATVALSGSPATFAVTADQLWHDPAILAKVIEGGASLVGDGTNASSAAAAANLGSAPAYTGTLRFSDTAANVTTYLASLQALANTSNLGAIALTNTGTPAISLTAAQLTANGGALALIGGTWSIAIASGTFTAAQALAIGSTVLAHVTAALPVRDTSTNIVANLDALQARASAIGAVTFSNGTPTLSLTGTKITSDINVLSVASGYSLSLSGTLTAAQAATITGTPVVARFTVGPAISDTTASIAAQLPALLTLANASKLGAITPTDSTSLTVTPDGLTTYLPVLRKITTSYTLALTAPLTADQAVGVNSLLVARLPSNLVVTDSAANVLADLDALQVLAAGSHLGTVNLTDAGLPVLNVTADQMTSDANVIATIAGTYKIAIQGGITAAQATLYASNTDRLAGGINVVCAAADVSANMTGLQTLAAAQLLSSIAFTDSGTPNLALTASVFAASYDALAAIVGSFTVTLTGTLTVAQVAAASTAGLLPLIVGGAAISDTAAHVQAALDTLTGYAAAVASIALNDGGTPALALTATALLANTATLGLISGTWSLTVSTGTVTVAQALALAPALTAHLSPGLPVSDTAANVNASLAGLHAMGAALGTIALTDGSPVLTLTAASLITYATTLLKIGGAYGITLSGTATAAQAAAFNATLVGKLTAGIAVSDTAANVTTNLDAIQTRATAGKLASVALTDGGTPTISVTAATVAADQGALALTTGTWTLAVASGTFTAAAAAAIPAAVTAHLGAGVNVSDTAANLTARLDDLQAQGTAIAQVSLTDAGTPALALTSATLNADAATLAKIQTAFSITLTGTLTAAQAATLQTAGLLARISGGAAISDTAAHVQAAIDALQADGASIASIALTDATLPTITLTAAQAVADQAALLKIGSAFDLTISSGTVTIAQLQAFSPVLAAHLTAGFTISDTAANFNAQIDALSTQNLVSGLNPAIGSFVLTDAGTPSISLTSHQFEVDDYPLTLITSPYTIAVTDSTTAANQNPVPDGIVAKVSPGLNIVDIRFQVQANLASLQRHIASIASITLTDGSTPTFSVTASEFVASPDVLALIGGSWNLTITSGTFTAAQAVALPPAATAHLTAGLAVSDTAAHVAASIGALTGMGAALGSVALTDAGTPSLALTGTQFVANAATLLLVSGSYAVALSGTLTTAQAVTAGNATLLQHVTGGAAISDTAAHVQSDMSALQGFGSAVASIALTDAGTPAISTDTAGLIANAALLAKVGGPWTLAVTTGTVTVAQILALPAATTAHLGTGLALSDLAANVTGNLASLQALGSVVGTIAFTDGSTPYLVLTASQLVTYGTLLQKAGGSGYTINLSGNLTVAQAVTANTQGLLANVELGANLSDTAANVQAALDTLQTLGNSIGGIALTDSGTPTINVTAGQLLPGTDIDTLQKISDPRTYTVTSGTLTAAQAVAVPGTITSRLTAGLNVSDTAANVTTELHNLQLSLAALGAIALTDAGTPAITVTAASVITNQGALALIGGTWDLAVSSGTVTAAQAAALDATVAGHLAAGLAVSDTAANVSANLDALQAKGATVATVALTDGAPALSMTAAQLIADATLLLKVTGTFGIAVTGTATASQAAAVNATLAADLSAGLDVSDTAAHVSTSLGGLQTLQTAGKLNAIALTDAGTPTVTASATAIFADQATLALIGGSWNLTASGGSVTTAQATGLNGTVTAHLTAGLAVADTAANVATGLDALQSAGAAVGAITLTDGGTPALSMTAAQFAADSTTLQKVAGSFSVTLTSGTLTAAQAAAAETAGLLVRVSGGAAISDTAANVQAALDTLQAYGAKVASIALTDGGTPAVTVTAAQLTADSATLLKISGTFGITVTGSASPQNAAALDPSLRDKLTAGLNVSGTAAGVGANLDGLQTLAAASKLGTVTLSDAGTPTVAATSTQLIADAPALLLIAGSHTVTLSGSLAVADAQTAHGNGLLAQVLNGAPVSDTAANVQAALDTLQGYGTEVASIALTDGGTPTVTVDTATLVADAALLAKIGGTWSLAVSSGTITAADATALPAAVLSHLATPLHVTGGATLVDQLQAINASIADITLPDATTTISLTAAQLVADTPVLGKVANLYHFTVTSGTVTAAQAAALDTAGLLALVNGGIGVSDTAANVQASLDSLQALGAEVSQIALTDAGTPAISVSAATLVADSAALNRITSGYDLTVTAGTFLAAEATALPAGPLQHLAAGINVADTGANVTTALASLQALAAAGQIGSIALSDNGTITATAAGARAAATALQTLTGTWSLSVSSGTFTAAQAAALVSQGTAAHLSGTIALTDTTARLLNGIGTLQTLSAASHLGTVTTTSSPSALNVTAAQATNSTAAINALLGATGSNPNATLYINGTTSGDTVDASVFSRAMDISLNGNTATMTFAGPAATVSGTADTLALGSAATTIEAPVSSGVEIVNGFQFGTDILDIALGSGDPANLTLSDITLNAQTAVAIKLSTDPTHGIILVNPGLSAAAITNDYLFTAGTHVIIS